MYTILALLLLVAFTSAKPGVGSINPTSNKCSLESSDLTTINGYVTNGFEYSGLLKTDTFASANMMVMHAAGSLNTKLDAFITDSETNQGAVSLMASLREALSILDTGVCSNSSQISICRISGYGLTSEVAQFYSYQRLFNMTSNGNAKLDVVVDGALSAYLAYIKREYGGSDICFPLRKQEADAGSFDYYDPLDDSQPLINCNSDSSGAVVDVEGSDDGQGRFRCAASGESCVPLVLDILTSEQVAASPVESPKLLTKSTVRFKVAHPVYKTKPYKP